MDKDPGLERALLCVRAVIEKKAENIKVLDLRERSGFTDFLIICSGTSDRQVSTISESVIQAVDVHNMHIVSKEGVSEGRWALIDLGDVVVHIFLDALRDYYDLENLWVDAPRVKIPADYYAPSASRVN
ncbi:MAG: ribosome silencing factor [Proteobacteria bacterium]|nr:MAG: ribosome silencing factor [Pseudomonadota bacterium]